MLSYNPPGDQLGKFDDREWGVSEIGGNAKRLKELEKENATLKRVVADKELEIVALREIASGKW